MISNRTEGWATTTATQTQTQTATTVTQVVTVTGESSTLYLAVGIAGGLIVGVAVAALIMRRKQKT